MIEEPKSRSPFKPQRARRGEVVGKSADSRYVTMSVYVKKETHSDFKRILQFEELEMSAVVEELIANFVASQRENNPVVKVWLQKRSSKT